MLKLSSLAKSIRVSIEDAEAAGYAFDKEVREPNKVTLFFWKDGGHYAQIITWESDP